MKKILVILSLCLICLISCNKSPSIEFVENTTKDAIEELLTEDNTDEAYFRLDRYFLSEQTDDLTYVGVVKITAFNTYFDNISSYKYHRPITYIDSLKVYGNVSIKFRDKKYDYYVISININKNE